MISGTRSSKLIPRGIRGYQKTPDKLITRLSQRNKPETRFRQKEDLEKKFVYLLQRPRVQEQRSPA